MKIQNLISILFLIFSFVSYGQIDRSKPPKSGPAPVINLGKPQTFTLKNGMKVLVVENNKWAIGMAHDRATSDPEIWKKADAFGMKGEEVDGMDVLAVRAAAQRALERARAGEGAAGSAAV